VSKIPSGLEQNEAKENRPTLVLPFFESKKSDGKRSFTFFRADQRCTSGWYIDRNVYVVENRCSKAYEGCIAVDLDGKETNILLALLPSPYLRKTGSNERLGRANTLRRHDTVRRTGLLVNPRRVPVLERREARLHRLEDLLLRVEELEGLLVLEAFKVDAVSRLRARRGVDELDSGVLALL
jgi:hypothetical protein